MKNPRKLSICSYEPEWSNNKEKGGEVYPNHPLTYQEDVIYLGDIPNSPSHCIVSNWNGKIIPMIHASDLRELTEEEL